MRVCPLAMNLACREFMTPMKIWYKPPQFYRIAICVVRHYIIRVDRLQQLPFARSVITHTEITQAEHIMSSSKGNIFWPFVTDEFPAQKPEMRSLVVFFDLRLNKQLTKQWWGSWFETPLRPLWRHKCCHGNSIFDLRQWRHILIFNPFRI